MNNLFNALGGGMPPIIKQFIDFRNSFNGDAQAQVQELLKSGRITQEQYNQAVQMAQQLQQILPPSVHRR